MPEHNSISWYLHKNGRTSGPHSTEEVLSMIAAKRTQLVDHCWTEGMKDWGRLLEMDEFAEALPEHPDVAIPSAKAPAKKAVRAAVAKHVEIVEEEAPEEVEPEEEIEAVVVTAPKAKAAPERVAAPARAATQAQKTEQKLAKWEKDRRFIRLFIEAQALIDGEPCSVVNISEGGLFIKTDMDLEVGGEVKISLVSPFFPQALDMQVLVIRQGFAAVQKTVKEVGYALEFVRLNPAHRRLVRQFIDENIMEHEAAAS